MKNGGLIECGIAAYSRGKSINRILVGSQDGSHVRSLLSFLSAGSASMYVIAKMQEGTLRCCWPLFSSAEPIRRPVSSYTDQAIMNRDLPMVSRHLSIGRIFLFCQFTLITPRRKCIFGIPTAVSLLRGTLSKYSSQHERKPATYHWGWQHGSAHEQRGS
jgi:hypothetical protein